MSDSILVRVTLDAYDMASTGRQTQVYVQIPEVARASWLLPEDQFHGLQGRTWPEVLDVTHDYVTYGGAASNSSATAAWKAVMEWLRDDANREEMQAAWEQDQARRHPVARKLLAKVTELEAEREKLVRWHGEDGKAITRLVARVERRQAELVALRNDALNVRGSLSPNGEPRKVPFPLGETLAPAVDWLIARIAELEAELYTEQAHGRTFLEQRNAHAKELLELRARVAELEAEPTTVYRAEHPDSGITLGHYGTEVAARAHCEATERNAWPKGTLLGFDWIEDEEDGVAELAATVGHNQESVTGYIVTALEAPSEYDEEADE